MILAFNNLQIVTVTKQIFERELCKMTRDFFSVIHDFSFK